ncbi:MAG: hypothetical protein MUE95_09615 [Cyclobacteriaceae bacterium]|jgi:hypothetical protein|nr:hypothetical protein [Cyclobacteriaceae bacterium]
MKTKSFLLAAFLVVLSTLSSVADDPINTGLFVISGKSGVYKLIYEGEKPSSVNLTIYNSKGQIVYEETVRKIKGFIRPVNFSGMAADTYTIQVKTGEMKHEAKVDYMPEPLPMRVDSRNLDINKYAILVSNVGQETITVKILDANRNLVRVYEESVNGSFGKIFNLNQIPSSSFTFEVYNSKGLINTLKF